MRLKAPGRPVSCVPVLQRRVGQPSPDSSRVSEGKPLFLIVGANLFCRPGALPTPAFGVDIGQTRAPLGEMGRHQGQGGSEGGPGPFLAARGKQREKGPRTQSGHGLPQQPHALGIQRVHGECLSGHQSPGGLAFGDAPGACACAHPETPRIVEPYPCLHSSLLSFPSGSNGELRGKSALSTLLSKLGTRVGSARQPPLPPALPSPSLAGRRQLCGCSAHLPPPESRL